MSYAPTSHEDFKKKAFAIPGILEGYNALEDEFSMIRALLEARKKAGMTQQEVVKHTHTTQSKSTVG